MADYKHPGDFSELVNLRIGATVDLDKPEDAGGEFWLEVDVDDFCIDVQWTAANGFGFYKPDEPPFYGQKPERFFLEVADAVDYACALYERHISRTVP